MNQEDKEMAKTATPRSTEPTDNVNQSTTRAADNTAILL
jgi:hypothetical protein